MPGISSKLPDGWERSETTNGIPYYINHETERTQWDHPEMVILMEEIESLGNIKYAAYRTAMKLRAIQKKTQVYMVDLRVIKASLKEEGIKDGYVEGNLSVPELTRIITAIFINQTGASRTNSVDVSLASELVLNWILNLYDPGRMGFVPILSLKVALSVMCSEKVQEKYRYLFSQLCHNQGFLDRKSGSQCGACCKKTALKRVSIPERVSAEGVHRMDDCRTTDDCVASHTSQISCVRDSEARVKMQRVCKMYPIVGFRYRLLKMLQL
ncbi:hypothetical protein OS493_022177 [Desmophyllum pertusum]|uniref:WW domain-containing protein n=1 Tax=Desmophyllum pertusum TaxID=174260 RepID=A0A9W9YB24_9CNID|nr:hypothetical protein OS493_022177 [Desmophyllum pertusum]